MTTHDPDRPYDPETLSSREAADIIGVSYRQLDYLARTVLEHGDARALGAAGSGSRRRWPRELVARLEVATRLAEAAGTDWGPMARRVVDASADGVMPDSGWVVLDGLGDVHFADDADHMADLVVRSAGGFVARYKVETSALAHA